MASDLKEDVRKNIGRRRATFVAFDLLVTYILQTSVAQRAHTPLAYSSATPKAHPKTRRVPNFAVAPASAPGPLAARRRHGADPYGNVAASATGGPTAPTAAAWFVLLEAIVQTREFPPAKTSASKLNFN